MTAPDHPLDAIAALPPDLTEHEVLGVLEHCYGLHGGLTPLVSERDQNFRLDPPDGSSVVVKIANAAEPEQITEFQIQALRHLEITDCPVPVPRIVPALSGDLSVRHPAGGEQHVVRVVTWLPGAPVEDIDIGKRPGFDIGRSLAMIDRSLRSFSHPGESQMLLWDMQRAAELEDIVAFVAESALRQQLRECLGNFAQRVLPGFSSLRTQVIHNDLNPGNVLVGEDAPDKVTGVIDFGDMLRAPLVVDVAIAASYLRSRDLVAMHQLVAGFESVSALDDQERDLLYELVRVRLAATIIILHWRAGARSASDPYLNKVSAERSAERFFRHLSSLGRSEFTARIFRD